MPEIAFSARVENNHVIVADPAIAARWIILWPGGIWKPSNQLAVELLVETAIELAQILNETKGPLIPNWVSTMRWDEANHRFLLKDGRVLQLTVDATVPDPVAKNLFALMHKMLVVSVIAAQENPNVRRPACPL